MRERRPKVRQYREHTPKAVAERARLDTLYPYRVAQRERVVEMRTPTLMETGYAPHGMERQEPPRRTDKAVKDRRGRMYQFYTDGSVRRVR